MDFILPKNILYIISVINAYGYKAHIVGGCVRDLLLDRIPVDWDITTNASPEIIKSIFPWTVDTGLKHGTVTVLIDHTPYEVTAWRRESGYSDHRRPDRVYPAGSLTEDLSRRDFTINAMAYHPEEGLTDPFGGRDDIKKRVIRCVGDPYQRFSEDALRMLRAVRFSAQLNFTIDEDTKKAISMLSADLSHISKERIQAELNKILGSRKPEKLVLLWETGLSRTIFPGIENLPPMWLTLAGYFTGSPIQRQILLALLFYLSFEGNRQGEAGKYLDGLKYDKGTKRDVSGCLKCLGDSGPPSPRNIRKAVSGSGALVASEVFKALSIIRSYGSNNDLYDTISQIMPIRLSLSGTDLKNSGLEGKTIKDMLSALTLCVFEKPELNDRELLLVLARAILSAFTGLSDN